MRVILSWILLLLSLFIIIIVIIIIIILLIVIITIIIIMSYVFHLIMHFCFRTSQQRVITNNLSY